MMRGVFFIAVTVLCLGAVSIRADNWIKSADGSVSVQFTNSGSSGSILVAEGNSTSKSLEVKFGDIEEWSADDKDRTQRLSSYATGDAMWSGPTAVKVNGATVQRVNMTRRMQTDAGVLVDVSLIGDLYPSTGGTAQNGVETLSVAGNGLKLSLMLNGWKFQSGGEKLNWTLEIKADGKDGVKPEEKEADDNKQKRLEFGSSSAGKSGKLDAALTVVLDGVNKPATLSADVKSGKSMVTFSFPKFTNKLYYDPTMSYSSDAASTRTVTSSVVIMIMALFAFMATRM